MTITLIIQLISKSEMSPLETRDELATNFPGDIALLSGPDNTGEVRLKLEQHKLTDLQRDWLHISHFAARYIDHYEVTGVKQAYHHNCPSRRPFYYHTDCVDRNPLECVTFEMIPLADVPAGTECDFCYEPVHGPSGYQLRNGTIELTMMLYGIPDASGHSFTEQQAMDLFDVLSQSAEHQAQLKSMPKCRIVDARIEGDRESGRVCATFEKHQEVTHVTR